MKYRVKSIGGFVLALSYCAFLLNFLWEFLHGAFLYEGIGILPSTSYVPLILYATFVDAVLIVVMWMLTTLIFRDVSWTIAEDLSPSSNSRRQTGGETNVVCYSEKRSAPWSFFIFLGFLFAVLIEIRAVFFQHRWVYSSLMPTIFGIGLSPLVQLVLTGIISVTLARRVFS